MACPGLEPILVHFAATMAYEVAYNGRVGLDRGKAATEVGGF